MRLKSMAPSFRLKVNGLVAEKRAWTLPELYALPHAEQITRHICVEGWSAIGRWGGVTFSEFLKRVGADTTAKYVGFKCADDYYESIDMPTALHPQTLLAFTYDGADAAGEIRIPDEAADADQARLQESEACHGDFRHQHVPWRLLGRPGIQLVRRLMTRRNLFPRSPRRNFDSPRLGRTALKTLEVGMKFLITAAMAATLALSGSMAFAQASGAMANDSMSKDAMSKDTMSKGAMSQDAMSKDAMSKER